MAILIKGMEMPKSCKSCDLLQDYDGDMYCPLNSYLNFGDIEYVPDYVMPGCPISELPERKKGKWIANGDIPKECPFCGEDWDKYIFGDIWYTGELPKFCPNCGADMRGEQDG